MVKRRRRKQRRNVNGWSISFLEIYDRWIGATAGLWLGWSSCRQQRAVLDGLGSSVCHNKILMWCKYVCFVNLLAVVTWSLSGCAVGQSVLGEPLLLWPPLKPEKKLNLCPASLHFFPMMAFCCLCFIAVSLSLSLSLTHINIHTHTISSISLFTQLFCLSFYWLLQWFIVLFAGQPGVARAFALRADELCSSVLASCSLNPEMNCSRMRKIALTKRPFWIEKNAPIEHHCSHYTESWTYSAMTYAATNFSWKMNRRSETQGKNLKKKSPSKDSHDQPFNEMHRHDPLQLAMGASLNEHATPGLLLFVYSWHRVFSTKKKVLVVSALCRSQAVDQ